MVSNKRLDKIEKNIDNLSKHCLAIEHKVNKLIKDKVNKNENIFQQPELYLDVGKVYENLQGERVLIVHRYLDTSRHKIIYVGINLCIRRSLSCLDNQWYTLSSYHYFDGTGIHGDCTLIRLSKNQSREIII